MNTPPDRLISRIVRVLIAIEFLLVALYWINILCGEPPAIHLIFDLDGEGNLPTWFSSAQLLTIALTLWAANRFRGDKPMPSRLFLNLLAAGFLLLSIDETAQIHEAITGLIGTRYADWLPLLLSTHKEIDMLALVGICGVIKYFYPDARAAWKGSRRECLMVMMGMGVTLLGGSVLEAIGYRWLQKGSLAYKIEVTGEEYMEMLGETLILYASLIFARNHLQIFARGHKRSETVEAKSAGLLPTG